MFSARLRDGLSRARYPWLRRLLALLDQGINSSLWLRDPQRLASSLLTTVLIWAVMWWTNMVLFQAFALDVPFVAGGLVLILAYLGVLPNLMPGNVGPFYFFVQLAMQPLGIPQEIGLAYTVLLHAMVTVIPLLTAGFSMLVSESVRKSFADQWRLG
jgi:uncharacterized membrane protein YbhN (UPF0104 family)